MHRDKTGSGGLSFGPPPTTDSAPADIGFAPDIEELTTSDDAIPSFAAAAGAAVGVPERARAEGHYPLAEACLRRLLGGEFTIEPEKAPATEVAPFAIGPSVMRPPADLSRPATPPQANAREAAAPLTNSTDALLEDMVDVLLVGEDSGTPEVHLSFKPEVFGGLYLRLERREEGLFAHFSVPDDHARRAVQGHIDDLLARLSAAGFSICGSSLQVSENP